MPEEKRKLKELEPTLDEEAKALYKKIVG